MASFGERVVGAMKLDANTFEEIERDPTAMGQAAGVIAMSAVSLGLGNLYYGGISGIIFQVVGSLISFCLWALIVWLVGTKLMPDPATKADFAETFRVVGFSAAPALLGVITIIPLLGWLLLFIIWLWQIAAMVVAVRQVLDYSTTGKAVVVVLLGFLCYVVLWSLFVGTTLMRAALF